MSDIFNSFIVWLINTNWALQSIEETVIRLVGYLLIFCGFNV